MWILGTFFNKPLLHKETWLLSDASRVGITGTILLLLLYVKVRTAWRATGVTAQGGNLFWDSLLSTYPTAATFLREMVPGIDTCPVRCPWEATTCTKTNHRRWSGWNEQYVLAYSAQSTSRSTNGILKFSNVHCKIVLHFPEKNHLRNSDKCHQIST